VVAVLGPPAAAPADQPTRPVPFPHRTIAGNRAAPIRIAGLILLGGAVLSAPFESLGFLVRPLALLSLAAGLTALWILHRAGGRLRSSAALTGVSAAVLAAALIVPSLLGPAYEAAREPARPDTDIRVVPLPAYAHEVDQSAADWVDARRATLQQGRVRVEVAEVWIGPSIQKEGRDSAPSRLFVRVRLYRSRTGAEIVSGAFAAPLVWDDGPRATVRDSAGTAFEQLPVRPTAARPGGASSAANTSLDVTDTILAFEAPASAGLRLELPGAAWGGSGAFRFALSGDMIQNRSTRPAGTRGS